MCLVTQVKSHQGQKFHLLSCSGCAVYTQAAQLSVCTTLRHPGARLQKIRAGFIDLCFSPSNLFGHPDLTNFLAEVDNSKN